MRANVNNRLDTACTGLNTSYKMTMRLLPPSDGGSGGLHIEDESFSASLPQRRGSARATSTSSSSVGNLSIPARPP